MIRRIESQLVAWKNKTYRLPLILQGARQVGKTYLMQWLGANHFERAAYFNFDERPELKSYFEKNKDVDSILKSLSVVAGVPLNADSLLIFDEIQECPEALNTLKYFAEKKPKIPIICAGSLLGILLHSGFSFPVGKVEFLHVYPMTFREVLPYWDEKAANFLNQIQNPEAIPEYFFNTLVDFFKKYMICGGMPAVVNIVNQTHNFSEVEQVLGNLIVSYRGDFAKHPVMSDIAKIAQVFDSLPAQLSRENKKFVYQLVRKGARAREYEDAIQWLIRSGLVHQVKLCAKPAIPLSAYDDFSAFKLYGLDVGIIRKLSKLSPVAYAEGNRLFTEFKGALAENYILQSLLTQFEESPRYWTSESSAEIDFLVQFENEIIPVEVKSEEQVKSRSLTLYNEKFNPKLRIRYSLKNLSYRDGLLNIPHFLSDYTFDFLKLFSVLS
jgi:predicted AAA+ superfamily ATPase